MSSHTILKLGLVLSGIAILVFGICYWILGSSTDPTAPVSLTWNTLRTLNVQSGEAPPELVQTNGKQVMIAGFMVPLEDDLREISEFLLVPYQGACIHVPPPPPNQMVFVHMTGKDARYTYMPVWVKGKLRITNSDSPYGIVSYQMEASDIELFKGPK